MARSATRTADPIPIAAGLASVRRGVTLDGAEMDCDAGGRHALTTVRIHMNASTA